MKMRKLGVVWFMVLLASNAQAIKVEGTFTATKACAAYKSFKRGHNPGNIHSTPGETYQIVEENKKEGPWALILIPEISHSRRWVAKECGTVKITSRPIEPPPPSCNIAGKHDSYVLALSWQAGFCEHYKYRGVKPECDALNAGRISVKNITIHGLWPNKADCGHNYGRCSSVPLDLEDATRGQVAPWMPNLFYSMDFAAYQWRKHGTCQELGDDDYFLLIKRLAEKFDESALGEYLRDNLGKDVQVSEMQSHFDSMLGENVRRKIELRCVGGPERGRKKRYLNEFWINLPREIDGAASLEDLVAGAKDKHRFGGNCAKEIHIEAPGKVSGSG